MHGKLKGKTGETSGRNGGVPKMCYDCYVFLMQTEAHHTWRMGLGKWYGVTKAFTTTLSLLQGLTNYGINDLLNGMILQVLPPTKKKGLNKKDFKERDDPVGKKNPLSLQV